MTSMLVHHKIITVGMSQGECVSLYLLGVGTFVLSTRSSDGSTIRNGGDQYRFYINLLASPKNN